MNSNQSDTACSTIRAFADAPYIATLKRGPDSQAKRWSISQKSLSSQRSLCAPQLPLYRAFSRSDSAFTGASIRGNVAPAIRAACRSSGVISTIYSATEKRACCTIVAMTPVAMPDDSCRLRRTNRGSDRTGPHLANLCEQLRLSARCSMPARLIETGQQHRTSPKAKRFYRCEASPNRSAGPRLDGTV